MKKTTILLISMLFTLNLNAQSNRNYAQKNEEIKKQKTAYISELLDLSDKKSKLFWPIFNEFQEESDAINVERRKVFFSLKRENESDTVSEEKLDSLLNMLHIFDDKSYKLKNEYNAALKDILTSKQKTNLLMSELNFKREKMKRLNSKEKTENDK